MGARVSLTLSEVRAAIGAQLRANLAREINVDVDGAGMRGPVVRLELDEVDYWGTFGAIGLASVVFRIVVDPAGVDQSATRRLDDLLSVGTGNASSLMDAIYTDPTFDGVAETVEIERVSVLPDTAQGEIVARVHVRKQGAQA
jgi:hypothetical protein